jgi:hypothetical protein
MRRLASPARVSPPTTVRPRLRRLATAPPQLDGLRGLGGQRPHPAAQARGHAVGLAEGAVLTQAEQTVPAQRDGLPQEAKDVAGTVTHADPSRPRWGTPDGAEHLRPDRRLAGPGPALRPRFLAMVDLLGVQGC